jgi:hypothetical protein
MYRGERDGFFWLVPAHHRLGDLVDKCPELFVGRSVAVTAFDGGPFAPTPEEHVAGRKVQGDVTIAPQDIDPSNIPFENWDEWYLFDGPVPEFDTFEVFVNWGTFSPVPPEEPWQDPKWEPTWDLAAARARIREVEAFQNRFWDQLQRLRPSCYVADGDLFTVVTQSEAERNRIWDRLAAENA